MRRALAVALILFAVATDAAPPPRLAIVPIKEAALGADDVTFLERALVDTVASLPGWSVANLTAAGRLTSPKSLPLEARADPQPALRAQALGKETGVQRVLLVDATRLGDGLILYLQMVETGSGASLGSTTVSLGSPRAFTPDDRAALRAAVVRVIEPGRHVGRLMLKLDVKGAEVQIDGRPFAGDPAAPIELPVGTHALRVTHPAYHDFLRFIDVEFDKTETLDVPLAAYPLAEGEMAERERKRGAVPSAAPVPWYRSWWALTIAGAVITGVTIGIVWGARPELTTDTAIPFQPTPKP